MAIPDAARHRYDGRCLRIAALAVAVAAAATIPSALALPGCGGGGETHPGAFTAVTTEQDGMLLSAFVASNGTVYMVGGVPGTAKGLLLRWDGAGVTRIPTPDAHAFWWIHGVSDGEMWLAGESAEVHRFDGTTLTRVDTGAPAGSILFGVWGPGGGSDDLWIVGGSFITGAPRQVIRRRSGGSWSAVASPDGLDAETTYFKVWGSGAADVWIVGDRGVILRDQGSGPVRVDAPGAERYVTVHGCSASDVWAVGGGASGTAVHFDGTVWSAIPLVDVSPLNGVVCVGGAAYVGGYFGYAARLAPGSAGGPASATVIAMPVELQNLAIHGMAAGPGLGGDWRM